MHYDRTELRASGVPKKILASLRGKYTALGFGALTAALPTTIDFLLII